MRARSLRLRLLLGAMAAVFVALAVAWLAMTLLFGRHLERRLEAELTRDARLLTAALSVGPGGAPALDRSPADPRFETPASGLYWQVSTTAGALRSRSLWDQTLPVGRPSQSEAWTTRTARGPFEPRVFVLERWVRPDRNGPAVLVQLAEEEATVTAARAEFGQELALFLALLWAVLSGAAWIQVELGLAPLARVRRDLDALRRSAAERLPGHHPREIEPLGEAINALADAREADLTRAKRRAADLAHGLKTPLAALAAQSRRAREAGAGEAADGLDRAVSAVSRAVEAELARTRLTTVRATDSPALPVVERLVSVVERTERGANLVWEVEIDPAAHVPAAADDLAEMVGPLIENAARWARRRVRISGGPGLLEVEDDGPGIAEAEAEQALSRGGKLDEAGAGHGLGLAIARDFAEATGGRLELGRSKALGGLRVRIAWASPQS